MDPLVMGCIIKSSVVLSLSCMELLYFARAFIKLP